MSTNLNDIAREIAQDNDIESELSKIANLVIKLKELQLDGSLSKTENGVLITLSKIQLFIYLRQSLYKTIRIQSIKTGFIFIFIFIACE